MSGNICAATNSPSPCSKATTTSSTNPAPPGASSPTTPNASPQSHPEPGRRSFLEAVGIRDLNGGPRPHPEERAVARISKDETARERKFSFPVAFGFGCDLIQIESEIAKVNRRTPGKASLD